jgi:hypothetical protein
MPAPDRLVVLRAILDTGAVPTFSAADPEAAFAMVAGCAEGGASVVEFTNRVQGAHEVFAALARRVAAELPEVILGPGTIVDAPTAGCSSPPAPVSWSGSRTARRSLACATADEWSTSPAVGRLPRSPPPRSSAARS